MSGNPWIDHVRAYAKQHGISYMCAVSDPNCSKSYKEKQKPKSLTTPVSAKAPPVKTVPPKTESSSTNSNTFKLVDKNYISKSKAPFYIYI